MRSGPKPLILPNSSGEISTGFELVIQNHWLYSLSQMTSHEIIAKITFGNIIFYYCVYGELKKMYTIFGYCQYYFQAEYYVIDAAPVIDSGWSPDISPFQRRYCFRHSSIYIVYSWQTFMTLMHKILGNMFTLYLPVCIRASLRCSSAAGHKTCQQLTNAVRDAKCFCYEDFKNA